METSYPLFLIPLLPLIGAALNLIFGKRLGKGAVSLIACGAVAAAALCATKGVLLLSGGTLSDRVFAADWIFTAGDGPGNELHIGLGLMLDQLSAVMVMVVTWIALLIHIYATGYMAHDPGYSRFFGYLNLFTGSMLVLVLGDSLPVTFIGWEGVGLCSYLLIGFWYTDDKNADAGRKAFIVNRIGDFGFLLGMCLLFTVIGTLKYGELATSGDKLRHALWLGWPAGMFVALLIFVGCAGKSAQIPLYVWLPDAMAGPTPVSALIHAATMVTAGVYVVARCHVIFDTFPHAAKMVIAGIGALTALFAATIGIVQRDFKRVLAYSTVSQLGFMFVGVGTGAYAAGIFHLMTHAFFKAGLFLGAGSVMHAMDGEGDIMKMGGLGKHMPITRWTFFIYCLAIAGIVPFAGFFSKDAILAGAWMGSFRMAPTGFWFLSPDAVRIFTTETYPKVLWAMLLLAATCTAFYMWRLYFVVFTGKFRGGAEKEHHLHESPPEMTIPLVFLAAGSIVAGFVGVPKVIGELFGLHDSDLFTSYLSEAGVPHSFAEASHAVEWALMGVALAVSVAGIFLARALYYGGISHTVKSLQQTPLRYIHKLLYNKYYVDELYDLIIVRPLKFSAWFFWYVVDAFFIDKILVHTGAFFIGAFGKAIRYVQNGDSQRNLISALVGMAGILYVTTTWSACQGSDFKLTQAGRTVTVESKGNPRGLLYSMDWDGDGKWDVVDSPFSTLSTTYQGAGTYKITMKARHARWGTASSSNMKVTVE